MHMTSLTPEGKHRFDTTEHNLSPNPHHRGEGDNENPLTVASRRGHRSSEGNIKEVGISGGPWEGNPTSLETTGGSFWRQQPKKKKLSRPRLLTTFPPPPTGGVVQELNTSNPAQLGVECTKPHRHSMPVVSMDTVILNRDLVDDVPVEVPRHQWVEEPSVRQRPQMYSTNMYRVQSSTEVKTGGDSPDTRSHDRSLSMSTHVTSRIAGSESSNSRRLPMESIL